MKTPVKYLEVIGFVIVHVESSEQLTVPRDGQSFHLVHSIHNGLASKLLHLDVVELPEVTEPLDQLGGNTAIELGIQKTFLFCYDQGLIGQSSTFE